MDRYDHAEQYLHELGYSTNSFSDFPLVAEALERGVEVDVSRNGQRIALRKNGKTWFWRMGASSLNSRLAIKMTHRKDVCSRYVRGYLPENMAENCVFSAGEARRAWRWAKPLKTWVIKPQDGIHGRDVHVGLHTRREFHAAFTRVARKYGHVLVESFHHGIEHRCLVVDNTLLAVTRRRPASVLGDGSSTIEDLVELKNRDRGRVHKQLSLNTKARKTLAKAGYGPDSTPDAGERVYLSETSNIHTGADAVDATDEISDDHKAIIETAARKIPGLRVAGFDVLLPPSYAVEESKPIIIEINAGPMTSMHHFPVEGQPRDVSKIILEAMFPALKAG